MDRGQVSADFADELNEDVDIRPQRPAGPLDLFGVAAGQVEAQPDPAAGQYDPAVLAACAVPRFSTHVQALGRPHHDAERVGAQEVPDAMCPVEASHGTD